MADLSDIDSIDRIIIYPKLKQISVIRYRGDGTPEVENITPDQLNARTFSTDDVSPTVPRAQQRRWFDTQITFSHDHELVVDYLKRSAE